MTITPNEYNSIVAMAMSDPLLSWDERQWHHPLSCNDILPSLTMMTSVNCLSTVISFGRHWQPMTMAYVAALLVALASGDWPHLLSSNDNLITSLTVNNVILLSMMASHYQLSKIRYWKEFNFLYYW